MTIASEKNEPLTSLQALQSQVEEWIKHVGKGYFSVLTNTALLMEEVGELARLIARHYGEQTFKPGENTSPEALGEEMADILFVLICLANQTGIDLEKAFQAKLAYKTARDSQRHAQNPFIRLSPSTEASPQSKAPSATSSD